MPRKNSKQEKEQLRFFGMPMKWDWQNFHKDIWNPQDNRVFPPKHFGIGWGFNVAALWKRLQPSR